MVKFFWLPYQLSPGSSYALKCITPTSAPYRIENEIKCLSVLNGCDNIVCINSFAWHNSYIVLVMPFIEHDKFKEYVKIMALSEVQDYMKDLFLALTSVHKFGIIHRDIKPSNCLYNCKEKKVNTDRFWTGSYRQ